VVLKQDVIRRYNLDNQTAPLGAHVNLIQVGLDRCHKTAFSNIQALVLDYCNWMVAIHLANQQVPPPLLNPAFAGFLVNFDKRIKTLFDPKHPDAMSQLQVAVEKIGQIKQLFPTNLPLYPIHAKKPGTQDFASTLKMVLGAANTLLGACNSAIGNVLLGDDSFNRAIKEHFDFHYRQTSSGSYELTPISEAQADAWDVTPGQLPLTPGKTNLMSSVESGLIPVNLLEWDTRQTLGLP
jgi:hypothetical protein